MIFRAKTFNSAKFGLREKGKIIYKVILLIFLFIYSKYLEFYLFPDFLIYGFYKQIFDTILN